MDDSTLKRLSVTIDEALYKRLTDWQHDERLQSVSNAIRYLLIYGLDRMTQTPSKKEEGR